MIFQHTNVHLEPKVHECFAHGDLLAIVDVTVSADAGRLGNALVYVYRKEADVFGYVIKDWCSAGATAARFMFGDLRGADGEIVLGSAHFSNDFRDTLADRSFEAWRASKDGLI